MWTWWLIGYMAIGIGIAEGATYNKRHNPKATDFDMTTGIYSAIVIFWFCYFVPWSFKALIRWCKK